jgi:hypothetical protein
MTDQNNKFFKLGSMSWVLYGLLAVLLIAGIMVSRDQDAPAWAQCKESLFQQMFSDTCTQREGIGIPIEIPASPGQNT